MHVTDWTGPVLRYALQTCEHPQSWYTPSVVVIGVYSIQAKEFGLFVQFCVRQAFPCMWHVTMNAGMPWVSFQQLEQLSAKWH